MFHIILMLMIAGEPSPRVYTKSEPVFSTEEACKAALPAADKELEQRFTDHIGKKRGEDYEMTLDCKFVDDDGSI